MQSHTTLSIQRGNTEHRIEDLIQLFESNFFSTLNTRLVIGDDEPVYLPADLHCAFHQIVFAHGFYASALHEIAHWCVAGEKRRLLEDFGYWYLPDGRTVEQQAKFEQAEIKPQAIEWAFSVASAKAFDVSVDNLNGDAEPDRLAFKAKVFSQVVYYLQNGFPPQAEIFIQSLCRFYKTDYPLSLNSFQYEDNGLSTFNPESQRETEHV